MGIVNAYLPIDRLRNFLTKHKLYHYLSGKAVEGGKYYTETYDFFSLPLYAKENSIIPKCLDAELKTVYDFSENLTLDIFELQENKEATCEVYDNLGKNIVCSVKAKRENNVVTITPLVITKKVSVNVITNGNSMATTLENTNSVKVELKYV